MESTPTHKYTLIHTQTDFVLKFMHVKVELFMAIAIVVISNFGMLHTEVQRMLGHGFGYYFIHTSIQQSQHSLESKLAVLSGM